LVDISVYETIIFVLVSEHFLWSAFILPKAAVEEKRSSKKRCDQALTELDGGLSTGGQQQAPTTKKAPGSPQRDRPNALSVFSNSERSILPPAAVKAHGGFCMPTDNTDEKGSPHTFLARFGAVILSGGIATTPQALYRY